MKDTLNVVVLTESQLKQIINETVSQLLDDRMFIPELGSVSPEYLTDNYKNPYVV